MDNFQLTASSYQSEMKAHITAPTNAHNTAIVNCCSAYVLGFFGVFVNEKGHGIFTAKVVVQPNQRKCFTRDFLKQL